ncbi:3c287563-859c-41ed-ba38-5871486faee1 [Sclerotinia trifoliorum]|uniref:3c287563-859c-41ed-ba38-5871486faee1 n=1 Tax=Sclerotinia trifoliorum TaxID=28548 RepID=A0A8H2ZM39_9HELO|nr:3c287563-859c-41ed-ba38-5871486faee1 [Sclerotinia trifoliorum]
MYRPILLFASTILPAIVGAQQLADGAIVPFQSDLPSCASQCGPLSDVQGACVPPKIADVSSSCFCADARLKPFLTGTTGVSSVCGAASCTSTTDLQAIETWYEQYCNTPSASTTSSGGSSATSSSSSNNKNPTWFSSHVKWVAMLIVLVVGISGIWILAFYFRRRYLRKREREIEMRPPIALGPHQLQSTTGGYGDGDGAMNAAEGGHHKEAARTTVTSTPAEATRGKRESKGLQKKQRA